MSDRESFLENAAGGAADDAAAPDEEGMSLDKLSSAFAGMLGEFSDAQPAPDAPGQGGASAIEEVEDDDPVPVSPRAILEAMLFVGSPENKPLSSKQIAGLMRGVETEEIDALVAQLNGEYDEDGCPYAIVSDSGGYRLALRSEFGRIRDKFYGRVREARLSQAAVEVLSLVAYNQPQTSEEINQQRGSSSGAILSQLVRRQLLRVERPETKPRKPRYYTTERFLKLFNLASLDELPRSEDLSKQ